MSNLSKKEMILLAAAKLFRDRGYQASSMRDLAEAVNLKASSLYNHIGSKDEILKDICLQNADRFSSGMEKIATQTISPIAKIEALIKMHIEIAVNDYTAVTSFNDEWRHLEEPALTEFTDKRKSYEKQFLDIINKGIEQNEIRAIDPQICLYTLLSSTRWVYDSNSRKDLKGITDTVSKMLVDGIRA